MDHEPRNSQGAGGNSQPYRVASDPGTQVLPLSMLQRQFVDPSLVVDVTLSVRTSASVDQIFDAVRRVCRRHDIMRTTIDAAESTQTVYAADTPGVRCSFLETLADETSLARLAAPAEDPIQVDTLPAYRCTVARSLGGDTLVHLASHHTLTDRSSMHAIVREIGAILNQGVSLPTPHQFHSHVREQMSIGSSDATWGEGGRGQRAIRHWESVLAGATAPHILQGSGSRPEAEPPGRSSLQRLVVPIEVDIAARAGQLSTDLRVGPFHVYLVAYALAIARRTASEDIATMCLTHGRNTPATRDMVGLLTTDTVIRHRLNAARPRDAITSSSANAMESYRHQVQTITELSRRSEIIRAFLRQRRSRRLMFQYRPHDIGEGVRWPGGETARTIRDGSLEDGWVIPGVLLFSVDDSGGRTSVEALFDPEEFGAAATEQFCMEFVECCRRVTEAPDEPVEIHRP